MFCSLTRSPRFHALKELDDGLRIESVDVVVVVYDADASAAGIHIGPGFPARVG